MAVHITNRHLDLAPVVQKLADHHQLKLAYIPYTIGDVAWHYGSFWMLLSRDASFLEGELIRSGAVKLERKNVRLWTDDYASLLPLLKYESR